MPPGRGRRRRDRALSDAGAESFLIVQTPDGGRKRVELTGTRVSIGRSRDNDLCFPEDASLSRIHLTLDREGGQWWVQDQRSKNGTKLNGQPVRGRQPLRPSDRLLAGRLTLVFEGDPAQFPDDRVEFYRDGADGLAGATVMTSLDGVLSAESTGAGTERVEEAAFRPDAAVKALIRAGRELVRLRPLSELFELILELSIEAVGAERGVILTVEGTRWVLRATRGDGFRISAAVRDRVLEHKTSVLVQDVSKDEAFQHAHSLLEQNVRSMMAVPLQTDRQVLGLVYVDSRTFQRTFGTEDLNLLTVLANVAAIRIEHQRLQEVETNERLMARELEQAAAIQRQLLPARPPEIVGLDVAGSMAACRTVGGDYYDWFPYRDGSVGVVIADVSGKGMPAAVVMSNLQARVRLLADERGDMAALVARLDASVAPTLPENRFVSLFSCVLEPSGRIEYCNAGHNPPILLRASGEFEMLADGGLALGLLTGRPYRGGTAQAGPGDLLMLFSDGVTEATDPDDNEYGTDRLVALLRDVHGQSAEDVVKRVGASLQAWAAGAPPADDVTMIVARFLPH